jgi:hypothetical protein
MKPDSEVWQHLFFPCGFFQILFFLSKFPRILRVFFRFLANKLQSKHNLEGVADPQLLSSNFCSNVLSWCTVTLYGTVHYRYTAECGSLSNKS